jgi:hypothetical protein
LHSVALLIIITGMELKPLNCLIPKVWRDGAPVPCGAYLCDIDAASNTTVRFTCRQKHFEGHSNRIEFKQDNGVITFRELPPDEKKSYSTDNGVRFPAVEEEVAV